MNNHYQETFETWNKVASLYQDKFMNLDLYNDSYDEICNSLSKPNSTILEIGCGPGNITKYLLAKRPDFNIFGIDISPNMIELAKANNPNASFQVMDIRQIDQIESKFDGIVCGFCLPYLSETDCQKLIVDCYNLMDNNGLLYISFVEGDPTNSGFQTSSSGDRAYFYYHSLEKLNSLLIENHFHEIQIQKVEYKRSEDQSEVHTIITAKRKSD